jgi:hypothetical protein
MMVDQGVVLEGVLKHLAFHLISFSVQWAMYIALLYIGGLYQVPCTKPPTVD